jgi:DNA-binding transcriptional regulator YdaS (Cro superfamily)
MDAKPIQDVIARVGSRAKLAEMLGIHRTAVYHWGHVIPLRHVQPISKRTGLPLHRLRPDVWEPPETERAA